MIGGTAEVVRKLSRWAISWTLISSSKPSGIPDTADEYIRRIFSLAITASVPSSRNKVTETGVCVPMIPSCRTRLFNSTT